MEKTQIIDFSREHAAYKEGYKYIQQRAEIHKQAAKWLEELLPEKPKAESSSKFRRKKISESKKDG